MTDDQIIEGIRTGEAAQHAAVEYIYKDKKYRKCAENVVRNYPGLRLEDWEGVFHESIVQLLKSVKKGKFDGSKALVKYFDGICRNVCRKFYRDGNKDRNNEDKLQIEEVDYETPFDLLVDDEIGAILDEAFEQLSEQCRKILKLWALRYKMTEIAELCGLKNQRNAITYRSRCMQRLKNIMKNDPRINQL